MTSSSIASSLSRQARLHVTPPPITLAETNAILKALQSFGPVSAFLSPLYVPGLRACPRSTFYAIFNESKALEKAKAASPITVQVGHDFADPKEVDPFNLRGLWDRKQVERKTFHCAVHGETDPYRHTRIVEENLYHMPFRLDRLAVSFHDLMKQSTPLPHFADCFQKRHMHDSDKAKFEAEAKARGFYKTDENGDSHDGLMDLWRAKHQVKS